jgi:hypothetical protein
MKDSRKIYSLNPKVFFVNLDSFKTSLDLSQFIYQHIHQKAYLEYKKEKYQLLSVKFHNPIIEKSNLYVYPFIYRDENFEQILKKSREAGIRFVILEID